MHTRISVSKLILMLSNFLLFFILFLEIENNIKYTILLSGTAIELAILIKNKYTMQKIDMYTLCLLLFPQLFIVLYSLLLGFVSDGQYLVENLKYSFFIIFPIVVSWCIIAVGKIYKVSIVKSIYYGLVCAYLIKIIRYAVSNSLVAYLKGLFNSYDAYLTQLESNIVPFAAGILLIYFLLTEKKLKMHDFVLAAIIILNGKRIVNFALIFIILLIILLGRNKKIIHPLPCAFITIIYMLCVGLFLYLVDSMHLQQIYLKYGIMDSGRQSLYRMIQYEWEFSPFFMGRGLGFCEVFLTYYSSMARNIHSDVLRMYIETGFLGYTVYTIATSICSFKLSKITCTALPFILLIYLQIIYFTDNISIYISVLTVYYLVILDQTIYWEESKQIDTKLGLFSGYSLNT